MANELEERLRRLRETGSPRPDATDRARHAAMRALPTTRGRRWSRWLQMPPRRTVSTALAVAVTVVLAAVLVLAMPRGEEPIAITTITLTATPPEPGDPVDSASLQTASEMIDRRAEIMGIEGVDANVVDGRIAIGFSGAPAPGVLADLTAPGEFAVYDSALAPQLSGNRRTRPSPGPGETVIEVPLIHATDNRVSYEYALVLDRPAITNRDVRSVATADEVGSAPGESAVHVELSDDGRRAWHELTRTLAQRGALEGNLAGALIVLDGRLLNAPVIDPNDLPDGVSGGAIRIEPSIAGLASPETIAAQIQEGPLPVSLTVVR